MMFGSLIDTDLTDDISGQFLLWLDIQSAIATVSEHDASFEVLMKREIGVAESICRHRPRSMLEIDIQKFVRATNAEVEISSKEYAVLNAYLRQCVQHQPHLRG